VVAAPSIAAARSLRAASSPSPSTGGDGGGAAVAAASAEAGAAAAPPPPGVKGLGVSGGACAANGDLDAPGDAPLRILEGKRWDWQRSIV